MSASGLNQHTTDLPPLGREGATSQWSTLLHQAFMMLVINGFRFFAVFAMFPIMVFMIMEVSGYIVLMTTGVRHQKREAAELAKTSKATQSGVPKDDTSVSATALDNTQRPAPSISSGEGIRTRIINSSA